MALKQEIQKAINRGDYGILEQLRLDAFNGRNAELFYRLCNETGTIPQKRDEVDEERELYEIGCVEATIYTRAQKAPRKSKKLELYSEFVRQAERLSFVPEATFRDTAEKRRILRAVLGYKTLRTRDGEMTLEQCSDARVGLAFTHDYRSARNFIRMHDSQTPEKERGR